jgi:hypothetical protein
LAASIIVASLSFAGVIQAGDVSMYAVLKAQNFVQTNSGPAVVIGNSSVMFQAEVDSSGNGTIASASVQLPNATIQPLDSNGGGNFKIKPKFDTTNSMDASYPDGTYTFFIQTLNDGNRTNLLSLSGDLYPTTPHINNFPATQVIDPTSDFNLAWDAISGATSSDYVQVSIRDCQGNGFFQTGQLGQPGALNGLATMATIPAGTLRPGGTYAAELLIARASSYDTNSYAGALGLAAYYRAVQISLVTTGLQTGCSMGSFQLVFNFQQGTFGSGTAGLISFPQNISYYFGLFNVNNDTNYPDTVTFTGPSGSGLNNTTNQYNGGSSFGSSAFYATPQVNTPPFPPGGIYTVNYKGISNNFNLANPNAANEQVMIVPTVVLNSSNVVTQINWTYKNPSGATIPAQPFMNNIEIRVQGFSGPLYDTESNNNNPIPASVTNYVLPLTVFWTNVTSIEMVFSDTQGNQYDSYWNRSSQPVVIVTATNLPSATQGSFYSFLLSATGGSQQFTWTTASNSLPAGLSLNGITGELSGPPSQSGTFNFTVTVTDTYTQSTNRAFSLLINPTAPPRPVLSSAVRLPNGQFKLHVTGTAGQNYTLQSSTNLFNWTPIITLSAPSSSFDLTDTNAANMVRGFYRILVGP